MDKVAFYEEMILGEVFEKEASRAIDRYAKKISDIEAELALHYKGDPRIVEAIGNHHKRSVTNEYWPFDRYIDSIKESKKSLGSPVGPYFNTGLARKSHRNGMAEKIEFRKTKEGLEGLKELSQAREHIKNKHPEFKHIAHHFKFFHDV